MTTTNMAPGTDTHVLSTGSLSLSIAHSAQDDLFRVAERQNPKRAFLFVSTVLGRHIPVRPDAHRKALRALAERVSPHLGTGPVLVMSYAETAIGLGLGVFDVLSRKMKGHSMAYLPTTRFIPEGETPWFTTREEHSHAVDHVIMRPAFAGMTHEPDSTLVLVDDETTTGKTFAGLAEGLASVGETPARVVLVTLTDWSNGKSRDSVEAIFPDALVETVSLLSGRYAWEPAPGVDPNPLPPGCAPCCAPWSPGSEVSFAVPRSGIDAQAHSKERRAWRDIVSGSLIPDIPKNARVLVVGTGEDVWHPFLAAEGIENAGFTTRFIATTRSPVARGPVVPHQITFPDHYGLGMAMYLNNVQPDAWDHVMIFSENTFDGIPSGLRDTLGSGVVITPDAVRTMQGEIL